MITLDTHELAWAAGFFDGEGTTCCTHGTRQNGYKYLNLHFEVRQIDRQVLDRFRQAIGIGSVTGPYAVNDSPNHQWAFAVSSYEDCQVAVAFLWKWLSPVKRTQARIHLRRYLDTQYLMRVDRISRQIERSA